jgi:hypothetical protein
VLPELPLSPYGVFILFFDGFGLAGRCSLDLDTGSGFDCVLKLVLKRMSVAVYPPFSAAALLER